MMSLNFEYLYSTFTCTRTMVGARTSFSMIMISYTWAERWFSIFELLVRHVRGYCMITSQFYVLWWNMCTYICTVRHSVLVYFGGIQRNRIEFMNLSYFCTYPSSGRTLVWRHIHVLYEIQCFCTCTDIGGIPVRWRSHGRHEILTISYFLRATVYLLYDVPRS